MKSRNNSTKEKIRMKNRNNSWKKMKIEMVPEKKTEWKTEITPEMKKKECKIEKP